MGRASSRAERASRVGTWGPACAWGPIRARGRESWVGRAGRVRSGPVCVLCVFHSLFHSFQKEAPSGTLGFLPSSLRRRSQLRTTVPLLRHRSAASRPRCGGRSQGHSGLRPCPRPTRPRRPAQEGASCLKPHPRHSSQRHPGRISRGAWAGLESKASLPAPAGRAASTGPLCRAVPSRAEPGKGRAAAAPPAHVGKHMQAGAGPSVEGLLATGCDVSTMTSQLGLKNGAGVSLRGARCPPGRRAGAALCLPHPLLCCSPCTRVHGHTHAH